jgi:dipeptidyl-peptidase-3
VRDGLDNIVSRIVIVPTFGLEYPDKNARSGFYAEYEPITWNEIAKVSEIISKKSVGIENTRILELVNVDKPVLQLLQASYNEFDHSEELAKVFLALELRKKYASNNK